MIQKLDRLKIERRDLAERIGEIDELMGAKDFLAMEYLAKWHVQRQHLAMREYLDVLGYRIAALEQQGVVG